MTVLRCHDAALPSVHVLPELEHFNLPLELLGNLSEC